MNCIQNDHRFLWGGGYSASLQERVPGVLSYRMLAWPCAALAIKWRLSPLTVLESDFAPPLHFILRSSNKTSAALEKLVRTALRTSPRDHWVLVERSAHYDQEAQCVNLELKLLGSIFCKFKIYIRQCGAAII